MPKTGLGKDEYDNECDKLEHLIEECARQGNVIVLGDFNVHIGHGNGPRSWGTTTYSGNRLLKLTQNTSLTCIDLLPSTTGPTHTFCNSRGHKSYIDHILTSNTRSSQIKRSDIKYFEPGNTSHHLPMILKMSVNIKKNKTT